MKINSTVSRDRGKVRSRREGDDSTRADAPSFLDVFGAEVSKSHQDGVEALLNDLDESERRFMDNETLADFNEYKRAVQEILEYISREGFETKTVNSRRGSTQKEYFIVKKIDEKLRSIALAVTSPASRPFSLLKQCEEIRGLIFDFMK